jgi:hypothetical protein
MPKDASAAEMLDWHVAQLEGVLSQIDTKVDHIRSRRRRPVLVSA